MNQPVEGKDDGFTGRRSETLQIQAMIYFAISIAALGAVMMTLTSSPSAKGASFLWLPAALQLMAGVWLGPWRGMVAAGLGAYGAGILAYGGWGVVDIIMNPVAGGFANGFLPAVLFRSLKVDPTLGAQPGEESKDLLRAIGRIGSLLILVLILAFALKPLDIGVWGHVPPLLLLLVAPIFLRGLKVRQKDFVIAFIICVLISAISAVIGSWGQVVGGQAWPAALINTGAGWFLGDTVSAVLGLYMLAMFTQRARDAGLSTY